MQTLSSLQTIAELPLQVAPAQVSPKVHKLPSSQLPPVALWTQPLGLTQLSVVQGLPSSQLVGLPGLQVPSAQVSPLVQALPSLHALRLLSWLQPLVGEQKSSVHTWPSLQSTGKEPSAQLPLAHTPPGLNTRPLHPALAHAMPSEATLC